MADWESLVHEHKQLVWHTVYRLVGNHADALDCLQDTFLEAVKVDRKEDVREWSAMLRHLATVRALDLLRTRYRQSGRTDQQFDPAIAISRDPGPGELAEGGELLARLRAALAELPAQQAEVFCLCRLDGATYQDAATQLGLDVNHVGVLLHRANKRLRQLLASEGVDAGKTEKGSNP